MDNAKIHHGLEILALFDRFGMSLITLLIAPLIAQISAGVRVEYLPPYSPDLNPIEEAFSKIKSFIRRNRDYFASPPCKVDHRHRSVHVV
jgi:transposase